MWVLEPAAVLVGVLLGWVLAWFVGARRGIAVVSRECADAYLQFGMAAMKVLTPGDDVQQMLADARQAAGVIEFVAPGETATAVARAMAALEHLVTVQSSQDAEESHDVAVSALGVAKTRIRRDLGAESGRARAGVAALLRRGHAGRTALPG